MGWRVSSKTANLAPSLHNSFKIGPELFDLWCRLLRDVEASVLWFLDDGPSVRSNLQREARQRGVAPERLVFAPRIPLASSERIGSATNTSIRRAACDKRP